MKRERRNSRAWKGGSKGGVEERESECRVEERENGGSFSVGGSGKGGGVTECRNGFMKRERQIVVSVWGNQVQGELTPNVACLQYYPYFLSSSLCWILPFGCLVIRSIGYP